MQEKLTRTDLSESKEDESKEDEYEMDESALGFYSWHKVCIEWDRATIAVREADYQYYVACRDHEPDSQIAKDALQVLLTARATLSSLSVVHESVCPRDGTCGIWSF
jgi:hypothetical protein